MSVPSPEEDDDDRPTTCACSGAPAAVLRAVSLLTVLGVFVVAPAVLYGAITLVVLRLNPRTERASFPVLHPAAASSADDGPAPVPPGGAGGALERRDDRPAS